MPDDTMKEYLVEDHAYRLFKHLHGIDDDVELLPFDAAAGRAPADGVDRRRRQALRDAAARLRQRAAR